jgi:hypothetical protein
MAMERRMNLENIRRHTMDIEEEQDGGTDGGTENYSDANMSDASIERGSKVIAGMYVIYNILIVMCVLKYLHRK